MKPPKLDEGDVLQTLDSTYPGHYLYFTTFSMMDFDFIGARLSVFSDGSRWAIVIGLTSYGSCGPKECPFYNGVDSYGNIVQPILKRGISGRKEKSDDLSQSFPLPVKNFRDAFVGPLTYYIGAHVKELEIRGETVSLKFPRKIEREAGLLDPPEPFELQSFPDLEKGARRTKKVFRAIFLQRPELLLPTDEEMRSRLPMDLPCILNLSEWHHPNIEEFPSETDCFQQLAEVCVTCDPKKYRPTEPPNTHWSHWDDPDM